MFIPTTSTTTTQQVTQFIMRSPTALDRLVTSKNAFFAFAGIIVGVSAWAIWRDAPLLGASTDDPYGDPSEWTAQELRTWLNARNIVTSEDESREALVERVHAAVRARRIPPTPRS
ncbi:hypothetical protein BZA05DRAFT_66680 [Tricharina praecox]|uniref:uncharacterized protein n=1 Tax=Tricharina praecox TaxID=43433 RepID=UPI002220EBDD|nr:uncharacterized protein BZA05DRAFT_66680 [Tricharina praecox]KAI5850020.1 hypothetical protein BZA05DRAFT_66680 [Tricharina praecox]